ncbi:N-acetylglucosaminyltransferase [Scytonema hofmannii PCC 7110]|uniref:Peptide O-xylosyltransferase n=1 Tax=Scytonema hofmannii PCC 7110 TaxID=128403 RepID=A0A139WSV4_9CYAN|nr:beta-1,6-N-acetylglucosaminyltransferase [Scytonema hofmannii]KYC35511.1 N-acetylglucosaminyltransferase [Scytonema hofmannii PCC 7110]
MRVCYLIQSHRNPEQINRLIKTIKQISPNSFIIVSHDFSSSNLNLEVLNDLQNVKVIPGLGGRGNFSIIHGYMNAVSWLFQNNIDFDWLINLSGQDYPTQHLSQMHNLLAETRYDGFLEYFNVLSPESHWSIREGYSRYFYKYQQLPSIAKLPDWGKDLLAPVKILNYIQPFVRLNIAFGMFGVKSSTPFNEDFICYGGSFFCTLSKRCVEYLYKFYLLRPDIVSFYEGVNVPEESFLQTVLLNSGLFNLCNDNKVYIDFSGSRNGRPRLLTADDFGMIAQSQSYFARKFDLNKDSKVLDLLDSNILSAI